MEITATGLALMIGITDCGVEFEIEPFLNDLTNVVSRLDSPHTQLLSARLLHRSLYI